MKTAIQWQEESRGETSVEHIQQIQKDALLHAAIIVNTRGQVYPPLGIVRDFANSIMKEILEADPLLAAEEQR